MEQRPQRRTSFNPQVYVLLWIVGEMRMNPENIERMKLVINEMGLKPLATNYHLSVYSIFKAFKKRFKLYPQLKAIFNSESYALFRTMETMKMIRDDKAFRFSGGKMGRMGIAIIDFDVKELEPKRIGGN